MDFLHNQEITLSFGVCKKQFDFNLLSKNSELKEQIYNRIFILYTNMKKCLAIKWNMEY